MANPVIAPDYIFESSWEVCNKVGGIYTVLSSRAKTLQALFPDRIVFIGPDLHPGEANPDFIEDPSLLPDWKSSLALDNESPAVRTGRWNVPCRPLVILVDFSPYYAVKDIIYYQMWEKYGIDSTVAYGDYDEASMFAHAVGVVIESLYRFLQLSGKRVIAHLNEWMLGAAVLYLRDRVPGVASVFTTHATTTGRSICGNNKPLYGQFAHYNGDQMARELNVTGKHTLEKQAAMHADCFTTVSPITGRESEQLLGRKPDVITLNGFEPHFVPQGKAFNIRREAARQALIRVAEQLTGRPVPANALLIATSGRYEYRNKGIDVFIEALHRVKQAQPTQPILAFILVPAGNPSPRKDLKQRLSQQNRPTSPLPDPYITHDLAEQSSDAVCNHLQALDFTNREEAGVQIVFVPCYLNGDDGIFDLPYYDLLPGLDLTIFPSYYEPWGYTPLESIAFHVPTITTNLSGFGQWAQMEANKRRNTLQQEGPAVTVIERTDTNYFEAAEAIKNAILRFLAYDLQQIREIRKAAHSLSKKADWKHFIAHYLEAYAVSLQKK